jgi:uncharacterized membrane-anchored protein
MALRRVTVLVGLVLILAFFNWSVAKKEAVLRDGQTLLIELAPVDPRSLIQGDYMRLEYRLAEHADRSWARDGRMVVRLDDRGVAEFVRAHDGRALGPDELLLQYRRRSGRVRVGSDAFFFQEGHAERYAGAKYGELRVDGSGGSVLVGLRDEALQPQR